jgi:hypothetical protein
VRCVREQRIAVQLRSEEPFAEAKALLLAHLVEPCPPPHFLGRLDDERRRVAVELVDVGLEPAVLRLLEGERERVEPLLRAEPDETAPPNVDVRPEDVAVAGAHAAVDAVAADDQVGPALRRHGALVRHVGLEHELDAEFLAARLQDVEQPLSADAAEAVAARGDPATLEEDVDVVPVIERLQDRLRRRLVGGDEVAESLVGEHDAPAERVVGPVALDHDDVVPRVLLFHQDREVEAGRPAADAGDVHRII